MSKLVHATTLRIDAEAAVVFEHLADPLRLGCFDTRPAGSDGGRVVLLNLLGTLPRSVSSSASPVPGRSATADGRAAHSPCTGNPGVRPRSRGTGAKSRKEC